MHVITLPGGKPGCYHCGREFDRHPRDVESEEMHAKLCAIEDDDKAARVFHYHQSIREQNERMKCVWVRRSGWLVPGVGLVCMEGIKLQLEPGAEPERMREQIQRCVLPCIMKDLTEALDGTQERREAELRLKDTEEARVPHDPLWCPDTPVEELYPFGYVRHPDGSVEALPAPATNDPTFAGI